MSAPVLVFDASSDGHRGGYVHKFAQLLGGVSLIGSPLRHLLQLLTARRLLLTTFETMPRVFFW